MEWIYTKNQTPITYETSPDFDGKRSDFVVAENNHGQKFLARFYEGFMDGSEFKDWYDDRDFELENIIRWLKIPF